MKKLLLLMTFFALLVGACKNDFDVTAPWKEIPVVYAILSPKDTAHYIRVEKAFLDEERSALEVAQIADSLYYPENAIVVYLVRVKTNERLKLNRVDGVKEGITRAEGIFATSPNWLYKLPVSLNDRVRPGEKYRIEVERTDGKPTVTAETNIPGDFRFNSPIPADLPRKMSFQTVSGQFFQWTTDIYGYYFNVDITLRYREEGPDGSVLLRRSIEWKPVKNLTKNANSTIVSTSVSQEQFFKFLADSVPAIAPNRVRYFDLCDIHVEGGGIEILEFLKTSAVAGGLTGAEIVPKYSNISEGYGLFTAKNRITLDGVKIDPKTVEAMQRDPRTGLLGFSL